MQAVQLLYTHTQAHAQAPICFTPDTYFIPSLLELYNNLSPPSNTCSMVNFSFSNDASSFGYGPGVNAANLTSSDIANANARFRPRPRATRGDAAQIPDTRSGHCIAGVTGPDYSGWTKKELCKAVSGRRLKSEKGAARM